MQPQHVHACSLEDLELIHKYISQGPVKYHKNRLENIQQLTNMNNKTDIKKYLFVMYQTQKTMFDHISKLWEDSW